MAMNKPEKSLGDYILLVWTFLTRDMWRVPRHEVKGMKNRMLNLLRILYQASRGFMGDKLNVRASALTYTSLLAVVPVIAIMVGIARGFGFQEMIERELASLFPGQTQVLDIMFDFVESYLEVATSGIVLGIGIVFLIISVWSILQSIEGAVNDIFQVKNSRPFTRMLSDYLATILLLPILLILSSGISVFIKTTVAQNKIFEFITPVLNVGMTLIPYFLSWLGFTLLYVLIPNTKVRFSNALLAGFIAGFAFQAFQYIYISGQLWVNRYNAIYGTFAAIPLFLLWLQTSWIIALMGAEIAFAAQNVQNFYFEKETKNISHRYRYFFTILIMSDLCKRFAKGDGPATINDITSKYQIPIRLTNQIIGRLLDMQLITETQGFTDKEASAYQPALDINQLSVGYLYEQLFEHGSEDFDLDVRNNYSPHWKSLLKIEQHISKQTGDILLKDL